MATVLMLTVYNYELIKILFYLDLFHRNKKKGFKSIFESIRFHAFLHFATSQNGTNRHSIYAIILQRNQVSSAFHSISINCKKFQGRRPRFRLPFQFLHIFTLWLRLRCTFRFSPVIPINNFKFEFSIILFVIKITRNAWIFFIIDYA